jgi:hypothetical protein
MAEFAELQQQHSIESINSIDPSDPPPLDAAALAAAEINPGDWVVGDDAGIAYYFNTITGTSLWEKPACLADVVKRGFTRTYSSLKDEHIHLEPPPLSLRIFHQFDKDNSGYIDIHELQV